MNIQMPLEPTPDELIVFLSKYPSQIANVPNLSKDMWMKLSESGDPYIIRRVPVKYLTRRMLIESGLIDMIKIYLPEGLAALTAADWERIVKKNPMSFPYMPPEFHTRELADEFIRRELVSSLKYFRKGLVTEDEYVDAATHNALRSRICRSLYFGNVPDELITKEFALRCIERIPSDVSSNRAFDSVHLSMFPGNLIEDGDIQEALFRIGALDLSCMQSPPEKVWKAILEKDPYKFHDIRKPTMDMYKYMVDILLEKGDAPSLSRITFPEEGQLYIVGLAPLYIQYINSPTEAVCLKAVRGDSKALRYIKKQSEVVCTEAVTRNGLALFNVKKQTPEICEAAVQQNPLAAAYVAAATA